MTVFFDTSALVKLYVPEQHHAKVRAITGERIIASIARVEFASALWRKHRSGELAATDAATLERAVIADLDQLPLRQKCSSVLSRPCATMGCAPTTQYNSQARSWPETRSAISTISQYSTHSCETRPQPKDFACCLPTSDSPRLQSIVCTSYAPGGSIDHRPRSLADRVTRRRVQALAARSSMIAFSVLLGRMATDTSDGSGK